MIVLPKRRSKEAADAGEPLKFNYTRDNLLLDTRGWNIAFQNAASLSAKANELLASRFARRFVLNSADSEFFDYVVCLRNFLSHYSSGARRALTEAIDGLTDESNHPLKGQVTHIGPYLKRVRVQHKTRAEYTVQRLRAIAQTL